MFLSFKFSFVLNILCIFGLETLWATFWRKGRFLKNILVTLLLRKKLYIQDKCCQPTLAFDSDVWNSKMLHFGRLKSKSQTED